jgi:hypothetical protein
VSFVTGSVEVQTWRENTLRRPWWSPHLTTVEARQVRRTGAGHSYRPHGGEIDWQKWSVR